MPSRVEPTLKKESGARPQRTLLYVDDFPFELSKTVVNTPEVKPILLRFSDIQLPSLWKAHTAKHAVFTVTERKNIAGEAARFKAWKQKNHLTIDGFLNPSEPTQHFAHAFARHLSLEALSEEVVERVRNKAVLKERLLAAGLPVAPFRRVATANDIIDFGNEFGWPAVVKPIDGFSTINTFKISREEAHRFEFPRSPLTTISDRWIVEKYISWREWECCALVYKGRVLKDFISYMPCPPLQIVEGAMNANITLREEEKERFPIDTHQIAQRIVDAIGITTGYLHAEFFLSRDRRWLVSDVGNRLAGCEIPSNHSLTYNFDIFKALIDIHLGQRPRIPQSSARNVGDLLLPPRKEFIPSEHELRDFEGIVRIKTKEQDDTGTKVSRASHLSSVTVHIEGNGVREVTSRMKRVYNWFRARSRLCEDAEDE